MLQQQYFSHVACAINSARHPPVQHDVASYIVSQSNDQRSLETCGTKRDMSRAAGGQTDDEAVPARERDIRMLPPIEGRISFGSCGHVMGSRRIVDQCHPP